MTRNLTLLLFFLSFAAFAQDVIPAKGGDITINPILHGTFVMEYNNLTIHMDPYGGTEEFAGQKKPDMVLITDIHGVMLDSVRLRKCYTSLKQW